MRFTSANMSVHPRERGEHLVSLPPVRSYRGSSPRARGTPTALHVRPNHGAVHPRERGEHDLDRQRVTNENGSSPRARGTRRAPRMRERWSPVHPRERGEHDSGAWMLDGRKRFIPASAGNTSSERLGSRHLAVHPRERGEHLPLVALPMRQRRFIPASAGNTFPNATPASNPGGSSPRARGTLLVGHHRGHSQSVHPRERGEHRRVAAVQGSSRRFIPASAGNTRWATMPRRPLSVHPRERGEHLWVTGFATWDFGSSPRARGTPGSGVGWSGRMSVHPRERGEHARRQPHGHALARFIPASAGNTSLARSAAISRAGSSPRARGTRRRSRRPADGAAVHPRERGEHAPDSRCPKDNSGSSPRARGTP